jgi:hypothetical protein
MTRRPQIVAAVALVILTLGFLRYLGIDRGTFVVEVAHDCVDVLRLLRDFVVHLFSST